MSANTYVLSLDEIEELKSSSKAGKGTYRRDIQKHVESGELYVVFSDLLAYKGKDAQATKNSIVGNIEKFGKEEGWPEMSILFDKKVVTGQDEDGEDILEETKDKTLWKVILVNDAVHTAMRAVQNDDAEVEDDTDEELAA